MNEWFNGKAGDKYPFETPATEQNSLHPLETRQQRKGKLHTLTVGRRGPGLTVDTALHDEMGNFVNSTFLSRAVHTKGYGAWGYFETTDSMKAYTTASLLQQIGQKTPVVVRFSLAVSNQATPDTLRNLRGLSTKFYTEQGNWDLLCNHIPVFFIRDAILFPDVISRLAPSPVNNLTDPNRFWSVFADYPESTHMLIWFMSDFGTVKSFRNIRAYGVSTYVWKNADARRLYVKYHWLPVAGEAYITQQQAEQLAIQNPDIAGQELYTALENGQSFRYELCVQLMNPQDAETLPFDPLDNTQVWDERTYPLIKVGRMVLDQNPKNYAEQVEKLAFAPANLIPGLELSDDKMLQGRAIAYSDAQRHRLGGNFREIPVNRERNNLHSPRVSSGEGRFVEGVIMRSEISNPNNFTQAGQLYETFSPVSKENLADNIASGLITANRNIQQTVLHHLQNASKELEQKVVRKMLTLSPS